MISPKGRHARLLPERGPSTEIIFGLLGAVFLLIPRQMFIWVDVMPPNHMGYAQFPAALLLVFALMYAAIALDPAKNRNLIPYGALLKVSYCGVVLFHWFASELPWIWKPFVFVDIVFLALFFWAWKVMGGQAAAGAKAVR